MAVTGRTADLEAAQAAVRAGTVGGVVLIPEDFERHLLRREPATLTTYADGSYLLVRSTVAASVSAVAATLGAAVTKQLHRYASRAGRCSIRSEGTPPSSVPAVFILVLQQTLLIGDGHAARGRAAQARQRARAGLGHARGIVTVILAALPPPGCVHVPGRVPTVRHCLSRRRPGDRRRTS